MPLLEFSVGVGLSDPVGVGETVARIGGGSGGAFVGINDAAGLFRVGEEDGEGINEDVKLLPVLGEAELLAVTVEDVVCVGSFEGEREAVGVDVAEVVPVAVADC